MSEILRHRCSDALSESYSPFEGTARLLRRFGEFLGHLEEKEPTVLGRFRDELRHRLSRRLAALSPSETGAPSESHLEDPVLEDLYRDYAMALLGPLEGSAKDPVDFPIVTLMRHLRYPEFERAAALCDVMGRRAALERLREFVIESTRRDTRPNPSLEDAGFLWDQVAKDRAFDTGGISYRFHRGKIVRRVDRCLWHEAMVPLGDPEISYTVCCFADGPQIEALSPHFVLTRTTTLMQGGPFCDHCVHDRRFVDSIEHPAHAFFADLGPASEVTASRCVDR